MAFEAVLVDRLADPIDFTCADGTGIEKGTILKLTDPRTAIASSAASDPIAGIAAREKIASDGRTRIAVYRRGIFDMKASGAITAGEPVCVSATANHVARAGGNLNQSGAAIIGHALETATDAEVIQVYVDIGGGIVT